jgi:hypothetical protein
MVLKRRRGLAMEYKKVKKEGKSIPLQAWTGPEFPGG